MTTGPTCIPEDTRDIGDIYEERIVKRLRSRKGIRPVVMILLAVSVGRSAPLPSALIANW